MFTYFFWFILFQVYELESLWTRQQQSTWEPFAAVKNVWAVVVAQLVERWLPIREVCSSNPVIGKNLYQTLTVNCIEKTKIMKKGREWPILKNSRNNLVGPDWALFESSWRQFSYKSRFGILMGHFENHHRGGKIWYGYSLTTFDKFGYFLFQHIWSHCSTRCSDWLTYGPHFAKSKF